jgi:hypothetical protein
MVEPKLDPGVIYNETDLLAAAIHIDRYVMDAMDRLEEDFAEINSLTMQTFNQLNKNKHLLTDKVLSDKQALSEDVSRNLEAITIYNEKMEVLVDTPVLRLQRLCASCDRSVIFYGVIAKTTTDEAVKVRAQELALLASERHEILKKALGKECGCDDSGCRL